MKRKILLSTFFILLICQQYACLKAQITISFEYTRKKIDSLLLLDRQLRGNSLRRAEIKMHLTDLYIDIMKLDSAFFYAREGIKISQAIKAPAIESRLWGFMASSTYYTGDLEQGIEWAMKSLEVAEKAKKDSLVFTRLNIVGLFFIETDRNKEAIKYYERALQVYENLPESKRSEYVRKELYKVYANMAEAYENLGEYKKAIPLHQKSFEQAKLFNAYRAMAIAKNHLAFCYENEGDLVAPPNLLREAIEYGKKIDDRDVWNNSLCRLALFYFKNGKIKESKKTLTESLELLAKDSTRVSIGSRRKAYEAAAKIYEQDAPQIALNFVKKVNWCDRTVYRQKSAYSIDFANIQFETVQKEKELALAKAENFKKNVTILLILILMLSVASAIGIYAYLQTRKNLIKEKELVQVKHEKALELRNAVLNTQETERERIAKDLHDSVGAMLSATRLNLESFYKQKEPALFDKTMHLLQETAQEVRRISHNMMPIALSKFGLVAALENICLHISKPKVNFSAFGLEERLDSQTETLLFRIAQEALNNAIKYAQAEEIFVQIVKDEDNLMMQIEDNGIGFDLSQVEKSVGIQSMRSRAEILGAKLFIDSQLHKKGTVVSLEMPLSHLQN